MVKNIQALELQGFTHFSIKSIVKPINCLHYQRGYNYQLRFHWINRFRNNIMNACFEKEEKHNSSWVHNEISNVVKKRLRLIDLNQREISSQKE